MATTATDRQLDSLGAILLREGSCDQRTLERARRVAAESDQRLDAVLIQLGLVSERGLANAYASLLAIPVAAPERYPAMQPLLPDRLNPAFLRHARAVPLAAAGQTLALAVADPLDPFTQAAVAVATGLHVTLEVAVPIELEAALNRLYPEEPTTESDGDAAAPLEEDTERLTDLASEAPVIRLVNLLITRAVETLASDIHIEPFEDRLRVRYRYDGVLHEAEPPPRHLAAAITSRIKIMARLDIAERRMPQDGRIKMAVRGQDVDFRVSTIPSLYGETVVLRIL
ncbi:MAG TPA: ATPase, T2SS/T4P/T4SS family, partial [Rhodopila sp.]|nr:ATPase, T2SS/T4P/T4SS family [Rhodopila sp.]